MNVHEEALTQALEECAEFFTTPEFAQACGVRAVSAKVQHYKDMKFPSCDFTLHSDTEHTLSVAFTRGGRYVFVRGDTPELSGHAEVHGRDARTRREYINAVIAALSEPLTRSIAETQGGSRETRRRARAVSEFAVLGKLYPLRTAPKWFTQHVRGRIQGAIDEFGVRRGAPGWESNREELYRLCPPSVTPVELYGGVWRHHTPAYLDPAPEGLSGLPALIPGVPPLLLDLPAVLFTPNDAQQQRLLVGAAMEMFVSLPERYSTFADAARRNHEAKLGTAHRLRRRANVLAEYLTWGGGGTVDGTARALTPAATGADVGMSASAWLAMQLEIPLRRALLGWATGISSVRNTASSADQVRVRREAEALFSRSEPATRYIEGAQQADTVFRAAHAEKASSRTSQLREVDEELAKLRRSITEEDLKPPPSMVSSTMLPFWKRIRTRVQMQMIAVGLTIVPAALLGHPEVAIGLGAGGISIQFMMHALKGVESKWRHPQRAAEEHSAAQQEHTELDNTRSEVLKTLTSSEPEKNLSPTQRRAWHLRPHARTYAAVAGAASAVTVPVAAATTLTPWFDSLHSIATGIILSSAIGPYTAQLEVYLREWLHRVADLRSTQRTQKQGEHTARELDDTETAAVLEELQQKLREIQREVTQSATPPQRVQDSAQLSAVWTELKKHGNILPLQRFAQCVEESTTSSDTELLESLVEKETPRTEETSTTATEIAALFEQRVRQEVRSVATAHAVLSDVREYLPQKLRPDVLLPPEGLHVLRAEDRELAAALCELPNPDGEGRIAAIAWETALGAGGVQDDVLQKQHCTQLLQSTGDLLRRDCEELMTRSTHSHLWRATHQCEGPHRKLLQRGDHPPLRRKCAQYLQKALSSSRDEDAPLDVQYGQARQNYLASVQSRLSRDDSREATPVQLRGLSALSGRFHGSSGGRDRGQGASPGR